jgi:hypothetical protein
MCLGDNQEADQAAETEEVEEIMAAAITTEEGTLQIANKEEDREVEVGTEAWIEEDDDPTQETTTERYEEAFAFH